MRRAGLVPEVGVAFALSVVVTALSSAAAFVYPSAPPERFLIAAACGLYTAYVIRGSRCRAGAATVAAAWLLLSGPVWFAAPPIVLFAAVHVALVWLSRLLLRHATRLPAAADLLLGVAAGLLSAMAMHRTGSVFLATWSFFLLQAVPAALSAPRRQQGSDSVVHDCAFEHARLQAEAALERLTSMPYR